MSTIAPSQWAPPTAAPHVLGRAAPCGRFVAAHPPPAVVLARPVRR